MLQILCLAYIYIYIYIYIYKIYINALYAEMNPPWQWENTLL
jgi:hypothetical protein